MLGFNIKYIITFTGLFYLRQKRNSDELMK